MLHMVVKSRISRRGFFLGGEGENLIFCMKNLRRRGEGVVDFSFLSQKNLANCKLKFANEERGKGVENSPIHPFPAYATELSIKFNKKPKNTFP